MSSMLKDPPGGSSLQPLASRNAAPLGLRRRASTPCRAFLSRSRISMQDTQSDKPDRR